MKRFFLNDLEHELQVEISPTLVDTLDESLDNMTISLKINEYKNPLAPVLNRVLVYDMRRNPHPLPGQPLYISELINDFVVTSDTVEIVTENPVRYKHTLSLVQRSQYLTKHLIRNNVFSSPIETQSDLYISATSIVEPGHSTPDNPQSDEFVNIGLLDINIDLSKQKIYGLDFTPYCNYQKINDRTYRTDVGTSQTFIYWEYYSDAIYPNKWSEIFEGNQSQTGATLPAILFTIGNETRTFIPENDKYNMRFNYKIPSNILSWIQEHETGILNITFADPKLLTTNGFSNMTAQAPDFVLPPPAMVNFKYKLEVAIIKSSVYSVIESLVNQYKKNTQAYNDHEGSSGYDSTIKPLFKMPDDSNEKRAELKELLQNTQAPNFVFTQASMFDALSEIFRLFDATFRIDEDGYLEIEYFNDRKVEDKFELTDSLKAGRSSSLGEERYANRLITFFQNTKINHKFPNSKKENATAYLRSKVLGVPGDSDFIFEVPKPIDYINKAYILSKVQMAPYQTLYSYGSYPNAYTVYFIRRWSNNETFSLDITNNIVEENIWVTLSESTSMPVDGDWNKVGKINSFTFKRGSKYIDISGFYNTTFGRRLAILNAVLQSALYKEFGVGSYSSSPLFQIISLPTPNWVNTKLAVDYVALVDGKLVNESIDNKYEGEILTNQNNGSIDIFKLGLNMVGLSLKLGQPTLTMTQTFTDWVNRIRKGQWFVENGEIWVANTCSYTLITPDQVQATIEFVKNFNSLASRIELNREKRLTNISNELTVKCEENYGEFVYFDDLATPEEELGENIAMTNLIMLAGLLRSIGYETQELRDIKVEYAIIDSLDSNDNIIALDSGYNLNDIAIPLVIYGSGNSICFEISFDSPISAGNQLLNEYPLSNWSDSPIISSFSGWFSRAVLYTREDGTVDKFNIKFITLSEDLTRLFPMMKKQIVSGNDYSASNLTSLNYLTVGSLLKFEYDKKPNEIFALNYQLHFLPHDRDCFLGNEFIKHNGFSEDLNNHSFHIVFTKTVENEQEYSILDTKGLNDYEEDIDTISIDGNNYSLVISINTVRTIPDAEREGIKTWALVDENNNIYFASNNVPPTSSFTIRFFWRHHRLV